MLFRIFFVVFLCVSYFLGHSPILCGSNRLLYHVSNVTNVMNLFLHVVFVLCVVTVDKTLLSAMWEMAMVHRKGWTGQQCWKSVCRIVLQRTMSRIVWKKVNGWDWDWNFKWKQCFCGYKQQLTMHNIQKKNYNMKHDTRNITFIIC